VTAEPAPATTKPDAAPAATLPEMRVDPVTGTTVYINASRQKRPNLPASGCPFCPGGLEAPEPYTTRWFKNRWPALPNGRAEVILYTPEHDATFWGLGVDGAVSVIELWANRFAELGAMDEVSYVLEFENRGFQVGATIAHPHGQIYAYDFVPESIAGELARPGALTTEWDAVAAAQELVVAHSGEWMAWVPHAAIYPFELRIAPRTAHPDLPACRATWRDLAVVLVEALHRLDAIFDEPMPYMMWWHQRPTDGGEWPGAHVHLHIAAVNRGKGVQRFVAAAEVGSTVYFNPVQPVDAAAMLRAIEGITS
jgi:UDPglucose--hexose-1-phosphate uridylyltransferase